MDDGGLERRRVLRAHIAYGTQYPNVVLKKRTLDAYASVVDFLTECTDSKGVWPEGEITVSGPEEFIPESLGSDEARRALARILGSSHDAGTALNAGTGESRSLGDT